MFMIADTVWLHSCEKLLQVVPDFARIRIRPRDRPNSWEFGYDPLLSCRWRLLTRTRLPILNAITLNNGLYAKMKSQKPSFSSAGRYSSATKRTLTLPASTYTFTSCERPLRISLFAVGSTGRARCGYFESAAATRTRPISSGPLKIVSRNLRQPSESD